MLPASDATRLRRFPRHAWPCLAGAAFVLVMVAARYDSTTGLTSLLRFGAEIPTERRLPAIAELPLHTVPGVGYDGQYYAQLAIDPDVRQREVQDAMDYPGYRPRRILLPFVVHLLTGGGANAWLTLHMYALANVVVWLAFAWWLWRHVAPSGARGTAVWLACLLGIGALDSVRMALTDLPATLLIFVAAVAAPRGRWPALGALAAAALTRDTTVIAAAAVENGGLRRAATWRRQALNIAVVFAPVAAWTWWIYAHVPDDAIAGFGHFAAPGAALVRQLADCGRALLDGDFDSRHVFGFVAVFSLGWQAVYVLVQLRTPGARTTNAWVRFGAPFALLFFVVGDAVWYGYWAVARTCLPLTFAFNLLLLAPTARRFRLHLVAGNLCLLHGMYRMLPEW